MSEEERVEAAARRDAMFLVFVKPVTPNGWVTSKMEDLCIKNWDIMGIL